MDREDIIKTLRNLEYRIQVSRKDDPERENAIRVRDRLLAKYGLRLEDIREARKTYMLERLDVDEAKVGRHFLKKRLNVEAGDGEPYNFNQYVQKSKTSKYNRSLQIDLTEDEHAKLWPVLRSLVKIYRRERKKLEKRIAEEIERRRAAFDYTFYDKAGILWPSTGESTGEPGFDLSDAIRAANELDGLVFPDSHIENKPLAIGGPDD